MTDVNERAEIDRLRARVAELEAELAEVHVRTNGIVAEAQTKLYWFERWHVDVNALMEKPGAEQARELLRRIRAVLRHVRKAKRRLLG
jgi:predicted trehalose synthase